MSTLALLGGLGTTTTIWKAQLEAVPDALVFDLPGHGAEPLPGGDVTIASIGASLLERLPERFSFCGVSMGGMVGMWLAVNAPDRVERLVLACTGAKLGERADYDARADLVRHEGVGVVVEGARDRWFTPAFREAPEARVIIDELATMSAEGYAACCEAVGGFDFRGELQSDRGADTRALRRRGHGHAAGRARDARRRHSRRSRRRDRERRPPRERRAAAGVHRPHEERRMTDDTYERGMRIRREVLGDEHVDRAIEGTTEHTAAFQDFITRYAWGEIWSRPGLDRKTRSAVTLTALTALGRFDELEMHIRAARRNGMTDDEIGEVLLQCAVYCGVPAANSAFHVFSRVLEE